MITLTTPATVTTTLGSATKTSYDRLDITTIFYDVVNKNVSGACSLLSSGNPQAAPIPGNYSAPTTGSAIMTVTIPSLPFYASVALTTALQSGLQTWISTAQNTVEAGFISIGVVAGVQSSGS